MSNRSRRRHLIRVGQAVPAVQHLEAAAHYQELVITTQDEIIAAQKEVDAIFSRWVAQLAALLERAGGYLDMDKPGAYELMAEMAVAVVECQKWQQAQQDAARARGAADD